MRQIWQNRTVRWAAPCVWMGFIFFLSAQPQLPDLTPGAGDLQSILGHLFAYAVLAGLWWRALRLAGARHPAAWALLIALLFGITDEYHQRFVPGRTATVYDLALDVIGASAALLAARSLGRRPAYELRRP